MGRATTIQTPAGSRRSRGRRWACAVALGSLVHAFPVAAQTQSGEWDAAKETLVVFNPSFEGSEDLANYYAAARHIPKERILGLKCSKEETIDRNEFEHTLREPLLRKLIEKGFWKVEQRENRDPGGRVVGTLPVLVRQDIKVLALMRGIPVRVKREANPAGLQPMDVDEASVDSDLAASGLVPCPTKGVLPNRYFQSTRRFPDAYGARGLIVVGRLDAADDRTVRRMIDDTLKAEREGLWGRAAVDFSLMEGGYEEGEQWLARAVKSYHDDGIPFFTDRRKEVLPDAWPLPDTILYFGWYTDMIRGALASPEFRFKPGAIACHLHSFSASVVRSPNRAWVGPLLDHGAAAVLGNVWEPYLTLTVHFDILNARLLSGFTFGEAALAATPGVSWMNVAIGDPLYRPFPANRVMLGENPRDLDYARFRQLSKRYLPHDPKKFRREILTMATDKHSPRLLELAGLLCTSESSLGQAGDFFMHASVAYPEPADQLRCRLYAADVARRSTDLAGAASIVSDALAEKKFQNLPALAAARALSKVLPAPPVARLDVSKRIGENAVHDTRAK